MNTPSLVQAFLNIVRTRHPDSPELVKRRVTDRLQVVTTYVGVMDFDDRLPFPISSVPADEMAFAMTFFVHAVNQQIAPPDAVEALSDHVRERCHQLSAALRNAAEGAQASNREPRADEATLDVVLRALCIHYGKSEYMIPVCARVLAFQLLMERTEGSVLEGWTLRDLEDERFVVLDPAVVDSIASVPLHTSLLLDTDRFLAWLNRSKRP